MYKTIFAMIYYEMALYEISMEPSYQKVWLVIVLSQAALIVKIRGGIKKF